MNAHIITGLNSGLGDMYSNIYRVYDVQQQLKNLGYNVYVYIDFTRNPYKVNSTDRSVFYKVFKLNMLDNLTIISDGDTSLFETVKNNNEYYYNYEHIYSVYVDKKVDELNDIHHMKHSWYYRDDLPKINFFTDEIMEYCVNKRNSLGDEFYGIHYRPFASDNPANQEEDLNTYKSEIDNFLISNKDKKVYVSVQFDIVKNYLKNSSHENFILNDYQFPLTFEHIRVMNLTDDILYDYLKETIFDMYMLSTCKKIYRIANWFSGFLFFSCTFNNTGIPNQERFIPEYPIKPL
jgi:hypothetical protein